MKAINCQNTAEQKIIIANVENYNTKTKKKYLH